MERKVYIGLSRIVKVGKGGEGLSLIHKTRNKSKKFDIINRFWKKGVDHEKGNLICH